MDRELAYELEVIAPYRKALKPGDVFAMKFGDDFYMHGRIINTEAIWTGRPEDDRVNLIYISDRVGSDPEDYESDALTPARLLVPPMMTPRTGWLRVLLCSRPHPTDTGGRLGAPCLQEKGTAGMVFR